MLCVFCCIFFFKIRTERIIFSVLFEITEILHSDTNSFPTFVDGEFDVFIFAKVPQVFVSTLHLHRCQLKNDTFFTLENYQMQGKYFQFFSIRQNQKVTRIWWWLQQSSSDDFPENGWMKMPWWEEIWLQTSWKLK